MKTAWDLTFEQAQNNGSFQIGVIGTLGATAFYDTMTVMQLEFPMLTFAEQLMINYDSQAYGNSCASFYTDQLGIAAAQAADLCDSSKSKNFTFADPLLSAAALTNVYLYQNQYNPWYY